MATGFAVQNKAISVCAAVRTLLLTAPSSFTSLYSCAHCRLGVVLDRLAAGVLATARARLVLWRRWRWMRRRARRASHVFERVFLVGIELKSRSRRDTRESLEELAELAASAGGEVVGEGVQKLEAPNAGTFIGNGMGPAVESPLRIAAGFAIS